MFKAAYNVNKFREKDTKDKIVEGWDEICNAILDVKDYLWGNTFIRSDKALSSYLILIPLIYFRYHFPLKWLSTPRKDQYILRTLLSGAFSGNPDRLIDRCTKEISGSSSFNIDEIFGIIRADGRNLEISKDTILSEHYGSKNIHLLFNIWYRQFNYVPSYQNNRPQVDHIFPQKSLKSVKDINPNTGRRDILRYRWFDRDQIANCMLLSQQENGPGGKTDILPVEWFSDKSTDYLDMHLIPHDTRLWELENYTEFIEARKKLIIDKFSYLIIKDIE